MEHERVGLQLHAVRARLVVKYEAKHAKMSKLTFFLPPEESSKGWDVHFSTTRHKTKTGEISMTIYCNNS